VSKTRTCKLLAQAAQQMKRRSVVAARQQGHAEWGRVGGDRLSAAQHPLGRRRLRVVGIPVVQRRSGLRLAHRVPRPLEFRAYLSKPPSVRAGRRRSRTKAELFKRFSSGMAEVTYVVGEFYWRVPSASRASSRTTSARRDALARADGQGSDAGRKASTWNPRPCARRSGSRRHRQAQSASSPTSRTR
jgi:hypothetical protein